MMRQFELVERVKSYDPGMDEDALNRAYVYAMKLHGSQKRESGDPYFSHPIEVAGILTDLKLDGDSIITALLHDLVEDTETSLEDIEQLFGKEVSVSLIQSMQKHVEFDEPEEEQTDFDMTIVGMTAEKGVIPEVAVDALATGDEANEDEELAEDDLTETDSEPEGGKDEET